MEPIFHIADKSTWEAAARRGAYTESTRDQSLEQVGFIHCSYDHQVEAVRTNFYADAPGPLVLLTIDPARLDARVQVDDGFPHIYGPLNTSAVVGVADLNA